MPTGSIADTRFVAKLEVQGREIAATDARLKQVISDFRELLASEYRRGQEFGANSSVQTAGYSPRIIAVHRRLR